MAALSDHRERAIEVTRPQASKVFHHLVVDVARHLRQQTYQRLPALGSATSTALLTPGARAPFYHDDHFRVSFSGGKAQMTIGTKTYNVDASTATRSYEVGQSGRHVLAAPQAPHCQ